MTGWRGGGCNGEKVILYTGKAALRTLQGQNEPGISSRSSFSVCVLVAAGARRRLISEAPHLFGCSLCARARAESHVSVGRRGRELVCVCVCGSARAVPSVAVEL